MPSCLAKCSGVLQECWRRANRCKKLEGDVLSTNLKRCLRTWELVLIALSHMLGTSLYVILGVAVANIAGASTILSYMIGAVVAILNGLCYAQFSVNIPKSGSAYNYVYIISGEFWGFLAGWTLILEGLIGAASVARGMSAYIDSLSGYAISNATISALGDSNSPIIRNIDFLAGFLCILTFIITSIGVKAMTNFGVTATVVNVIVLLIMAFTGYIVGNIDNLTNSPGGFFPYGASGTLTVAGMSIYAYMGFDTIATAAEETADPNKSLPRATVLCLIIACVIYVLMVLSLTMLAPYDQLNVQMPFPAAFDKYGLPWLAKVVTVGAISGMTASLLGQTYCLSRATYAMANDGLIFHQMGLVNSWTKTPLWASLVSATLTSILSTMVNFEDLAETYSIGSLFALSLMLVSLLKLHYIPADKCPFELVQSEDNNVSQLPTESQEKLPILPKSDHTQLKETIGSYRCPYGTIGDMSPNNFNTLVLAVLGLSLFVLALIIRMATEYVATFQWWAILFLTLALISTTISVRFLLLFEPNRSFVKYSAPCVPLMPILTLFANMCLMVGLKQLTWICLIVWLLIGCLVYFLYGIHHSIAKQQEENYIRLDQLGESSMNSTTLLPNDIPKED